MPVRALFLLGSLIAASFVFYDAYRKSRKAYNAFLWAFLTFAFPYIVPFVYLVYRKASFLNAFRPSTQPQQSGTICPKCGHESRASKCDQCGNTLTF